MRLLLIKERLFLFGEFALSKSQYLYNKYNYYTTCQRDQTYKLQRDKSKLKTI